MLALSVTVSDPLRVPDAVGAKATLIVQLALPARADPQLSVLLKSPLVVMALIVMGVEAGFVRVMGWEALVVPTIWLPKSRLVGASWGNNPKTPTPVVVPTKTFPFAIMGVMNLFPFPKLSRPFAA